MVDKDANSLEKLIEQAKKMNGTLNTIINAKTESERFSFLQATTKKEYISNLKKFMESYKNVMIDIVTHIKNEAESNDSFKKLAEELLAIVGAITTNADPTKN